MSKTFVVACGGTGGHVYPGLAVAGELQQRGHAVEIWLAGRAAESDARENYPFNFFSTCMRQLKPLAAPHIVRSMARCLKRMRLVNPNVLLAMGSYSSLPPVVAAAVRGVPIVLHEANAVPGKAVEWLSRYAAVTAYSFADTEKWLPKRNLKLTGLPVRNELLLGKKNVEKPCTKFTFFITGGSQGARRVNELASKALCLLHEQNNPFIVIHQCGNRDSEWLTERYQQAGIDAQVHPYINDMGSAYAAADFVIGRAGASTCFELCLLGKPALLFPLPSAKNNHQYYNAAALAQTGGISIGNQKELTPRSMMRYLQNKMQNPDQLAEMRTALLKLAVPDAAARVADLLEQS